MLKAVCLIVELRLIDLPTQCVREVVLDTRQCHGSDRVNTLKNTVTSKALGEGVRHDQRA